MCAHILPYPQCRVCGDLTSSIKTGPVARSSRKKRVQGFFWYFECFYVFIFGNTHTSLRTIQLDGMDDWILNGEQRQCDEEEAFILGQILNLKPDLLLDLIKLNPVPVNKPPYIPFTIYFPNLQLFLSFFSIHVPNRKRFSRLAWLQAKSMHKLTEKRA